VSRIVVIALGVLLWSAFAVVSVAHAASGDPGGPLAAVLIVAAAVTVWHRRRRSSQDPQRSVSV